MTEEDKIFDGQVKHKGLFPFKDFYKFCYGWLTEEEDLDILEKKYKEKLIANEKEVEVKWIADRKVTDYFKFKIEIEFNIKKMVDVEIQKEGKKITTNKGEIKMIIKGYLVKDYQSKFERDAFRKFLRSVYERWIITSRVEHFEEEIFILCDKFSNQIKAYLGLEGKK